MVKITDKEAAYIRKIGHPDAVMMSSRTHKSRGKRYYLREDKFLLKKLKEYRDSQKVKG